MNMICPSWIHDFLFISDEQENMGVVVLEQQCEKDDIDIILLLAASLGSAM